MDLTERRKQFNPAGQNKLYSSTKDLTRSLTRSPRKTSKTKQYGGRPKGVKNLLKPISLYPLTLDQVASGFMKVDYKKVRTAERKLSRKLIKKY